MVASARATPRDLSDVSADSSGYRPVASMDREYPWAAAWCPRDKQESQLEGSAPGWTRTTDPQLRRLLLYPAELRARGRRLGRLRSDAGSYDGPGAAST